jgi:WD40 repeat protein
MGEYPALLDLAAQTIHPLGRAESFLVGRDEAAGLCVTDPTCSRQHFRIVLREERYYIDPLSHPRNATWLNDREVTEPEPVEHEAILQAGQMRWQFLLQPTAASVLATRSRPARKRWSGWLLAGAAACIVSALVFFAIPRRENPKDKGGTSPDQPRAAVLGNGPDSPAQMGGPADLTHAALQFSPDGLWALSRSSDGNVFLWNLTNRGLESTWSLPERHPPRYPSLLAIAPDGRHVALSSAENLGFFDTETCKPPQTCAPEVQLRCTLDEERIKMYWTQVAFSAPAAEAGWLAVAETGGKGHGSIHLTRLSALLPSTGGKPPGGLRIVRLAAAPTRSLPPFGAPVASLAFSSTGEHLVAGGGKSTVDLFDVRTAELKRRFRGHDGMVTQVAFSSGRGDRVFSASGLDDGLVNRWPGGPRPDFDGTLRVWDNGEGAGEVVMKELLLIEPGKELADATPPRKATPMTCAAFWPGGRALTGHKDGSTALWDLNDGKSLAWFPHQPIRETKNTEVTAVAISPDGHHALAATRDGVVSLIRLPPPASGP